MECCKLDVFEKDKEKKILELCTEKFPEYSKQRLSKDIYLILNINARKNCVDKSPKIDSLTKEFSNEHYLTQNKTNSCEISKDENVNQAKEQTKALSISNSSSKSIIQKTRLTSNSSCLENFNLKHSLSDNNNGINNYKKYKVMLSSSIEKVDEKNTNKVKFKLTNYILFINL